jgi:hypothetical protein
MYTERDQAILDYLEKFRVATTRTLIQLFFTNYRYGAARLTLLARRGDVTRARCLGDNYDYVYYIGRRPKQLLHSLYLTEFHRELSKIARVVKIVPEYVCGNVRADGFVAYEMQGERYIAFVEVQTRNFALDTGKYRQLLLSGDWKAHFPVFPIVIAITDQKIKAPADYKLVHVKTDLDLSPLARNKNKVVSVFRQGNLA